MLKTVIFDMDGVIIDSEAQHAKASLNTFKELGVDTDLDYCKSFTGSSSKKMAETAIKDFSLDITTNALLDKLNLAKKKLPYLASLYHFLIFRFQVTLLLNLFHLPPVNYFLPLLQHSQL